MAESPMRIVCYLYYADAVRHVENLLSRLQDKLGACEVLLVYNSVNFASAPELSRVRAMRCVPYDGGQWEFGAYQLGLAQAESSAEGVFFINDTAGRNYPFLAADMVGLVAQARAAATAPEPAIVGKVESNGCTYALSGNAFDCWIRSNIFFLNRPALVALGGELFSAAVFNAPRERDGQLDADIDMSDALRRYLLQWLSPAAGRRGWLAHVARSGVSNSVVLRGKLGSILLEKHLSARLASAGAHFASYEPAKPSVQHRLAAWFFYKRRGLRRRLGL